MDIKHIYCGYIFFTDRRPQKWDVPFSTPMWILLREREDINITHAIFINMAPFLNDEDEETTNDGLIDTDPAFDVGTAVIQLDPNGVYDMMYLHFVRQVRSDRIRSDIDAARRLPNQIASSTSIIDIGHIEEPSPVNHMLDLLRVVISDNTWQNVSTRADNIASSGYESTEEDDDSSDTSSNSSSVPSLVDFVPSSFEQSNNSSIDVAETIHSINELERYSVVNINTNFYHVPMLHLIPSGRRIYRHLYVDDEMTALQSERNAALTLAAHSRFELVCFDDMYDTISNREFSALRHVNVWLNQSMAHFQNGSYNLMTHNDHYQMSTISRIVATFVLDDAEIFVSFISQVCLDVL